MHASWTKVRAELPVILTVPGLDGSGPDHWQTEWEYHLPDCRRVQMGDWSHPVRERWVERLDRALAGITGTAVFVAHSLGCLAIAWWMRQQWRAEHRHKLLGAMLVAPPCPDESPAYDRIADFCPAPKQSLPFPTLLVASRNDPHASFETSELLAEAWGSQLIDAGHLGHINAESRLGAWEQGIGLIEGLLASVADAERTLLDRARKMISLREQSLGQRPAAIN